MRVRTEKTAVDARTRLELQTGPSMLGALVMIVYPKSIDA